MANSMTSQGSDIHTSKQQYTPPFEPGLLSVPLHHGCSLSEDLTGVGGVAEPAGGHLLAEAGQQVHTCAHSQTAQTAAQLT